MEKLGRAEAAVGPEMKSTGEVMGIDADPEVAMFKAITAAGIVARERSVLASIADRDKGQAAEVLAAFARAGFRLLATPETASSLRSAGLEVSVVSVKDAFATVPVGLVVNTPTRGGDPSRDGFQLRRRALERRIPCLTSLDTARAVARVLTIDPALVSVEPLAGRPLE
jgi:carbamoyl-phosphate synthase large subunit